MGDVIRLHSEPWGVLECLQGAVEAVQDPEQEWTHALVLVWDEVNGEYIMGGSGFRNDWELEGALQRFLRDFQSYSSE